MLHTVTRICSEILNRAWDRTIVPGAVAIIAELGAQYHSLIECYVCGHSFAPTDEQLEAWVNSGRNWDPTDWECPACIKAESDSADAEIEHFDAKWEAHLARLAELDNDPRFADPFARPDWDGNPSEY
jgi:rubredoxin